jgi:hypothetical protein
MATRKSERLTWSNEFFHQLRSIEDYGWHFITTLGDSRFYLSTDHEQIWLHPEEKPSEIARHTI